MLKYGTPVHACSLRRITSRSNHASAMTVDCLADPGAGNPTRSVGARKSAGSLWGVFPNPLAHDRGFVDSPGACSFSDSDGLFGIEVEE
jgi:hypothetical protein